jgi:hypothetical protein
MACGRRLRHEEGKNGGPCWSGRDRCSRDQDDDVQREFNHSGLSVSLLVTIGLTLWA